MEKELGSDVIKATQTSLGKYVKRPSLTEKLLKKPPFRFLHDIVTSVLKNNGFFEGLFEEDELISDNVKDRDSKILFLNKVISVIALTTGKNLSVKPSKIVAGQEPEKTNELLQCLAYALDNKLSSNEAVKKYKENSKAPQASNIKTKENKAKAAKKSNDSKNLASRSSESLINIKKETALVNKNEKSKINNPKSNTKETGVTKTEPKSNKKDTGLSKPESQNKKSHNLKAIDKKATVESVKQPSITDTSNQEQNSLINEKELKQNEEIKVINEIININTLNIQKDIEEKESGEDLISEPEGEKKFTISDKFTENDLNASLSSQDLMDIENDKAENISLERTAQERGKIVIEDNFSETYKEPSLKNSKEADETLSTVKQRPVLIPKHKSFDFENKAKELVKSNSHDTQNPDVVRPLSVRPSSSRPGAPRLREKTENVISENENLVLGKVNIIAENAQNEEEEETDIIIVEQHGVGSVTSEDQQEAIQLSSNEHGHLVQQILNSQKELSHVSGKTEIEWQYGAQRAKEASSQEIEQLRFNIQALSRVANPLGKLLDHIQEDVEVMRQELMQWTNVYEEVSKDMVKQKAASEETLMPLQTRVKQLDVDIEEKRDKINDINILIHKNTARIQKLLANGKVQ